MCVCVYGGACGGHDAIHHSRNISVLLSDFSIEENHGISPLTIIPNIVRSFLQILSIFQYQRSLACCCCCSSGRASFRILFFVVRADLMEKGNELRKERKIHGVIARDSRMEAVTNVFRWHGRCDLAMNICLPRKKVLMRALLRPVLMQNPFGNREGEKAAPRRETLNKRDARARDGK